MTNKTDISENETYKATFYFAIKPGFDIIEVSKSLSKTIACEIDNEFPEIEYVSSCEVKKEEK